jgi:glycosyltransferase involved in cell wall biosynthesis
MTGRKRILLIEQNTDGTIGGSHHSLLLLVKHLDRRAYEPYVAFYERHALLDEYRKYAPVVLLPHRTPLLYGHGRKPGLLTAATLGFRKAINFSRSTASAIDRMAQVFGFIRPDVIHLNNSVLSGPSWPVVAKLTRTPLVVHQRGFGPPPWYVGGFDRVICISKQVHEDFISRAPKMAERAVQIYNGIETETFVQEARRKDTASIRQSFGVGPQDYLIGLVGNFQAWKGQDVLIRALPRLKTDRPWRCLLIGDTPVGENHTRYHAALVQSVRELGLSGQVTFTGYRADVGAIVNALDVLVHTSISPEPLGRVILEGMALEKPVIATRHGGPLEIIESGISGFLVTPGDPDALTACLMQLLASSELRTSVGRAAKDRVMSKFSVARYVEQVQEVYRTVLNDEPERSTPFAGEETL